MKKLLAILLPSTYYLSMIIVFPIAIILKIIERVMGSLSLVINRLYVTYFECIEKYHDFFYDVLESLKDTASLLNRKEE